ncbi:MAG TPA: hypothetical protein PLZ57_14905 [Pseudobdellovibrionaceae bacterium]|nr:hypothetical protein [Pseudobdellovibrionaceae bacterium]
MAKPRNLLIVLHGKGDDLTSFYDLPHELPLPQTDYLLLNAPYAMKDGRKWMMCDEPRHRPTLELTRAKLLKLVAELEAWGYSPEQILWLGHSQGGRVALDLILNSPARFAGLIGVSSYMGWMLAERQLKVKTLSRFAELTPTSARLSRADASRSTVPGAHIELAANEVVRARSTPILFTHGRRDRVISTTEIRGDIRIARALGFDVTYAEFDKGHEFEDPREMRFIQSWIQARARRAAFRAAILPPPDQLRLSESPAAHAESRIVADLHRPAQAEA